MIRVSSIFCRKTARQGCAAAWLWQMRKPMSKMLTRLFGNFTQKALTSSCESDCILEAVFACFEAKTCNVGVLIQLVLLLALRSA